jgi:hypothetical protein
MAASIEYLVNIAVEFIALSNQLNDDTITNSNTVIGVVLVSSKYRQWFFDPQRFLDIGRAGHVVTLQKCQQQQRD